MSNGVKFSKLNLAYQKGMQGKVPTTLGKNAFVVSAQANGLGHKIARDDMLAQKANLDTVRQGIMRDNRMARGY